ncbi:MAG TPA: protein kinase [Candidatus Acidoferrales bacterium]|nr:protein kinase [Candidatus Acidoferrales bacterium]
MAKTNNPSSGFPPPDDARGPVENQKTLLLSDVPEASALITQPAAAPTSTPHLSSTALAALSQRYDILSEAGHGSMGNVYKARDRETGETVALKLLKPEIASDQSMMDRFKNELLFARKITHKNVCRVHEFNRINGVAYTSMEFVEGDSLRSVLNRFGGLPPRKAIDLVGQICSGLQEAHAQGIVHRDLKPENVMLDAQGNVKIMDFGIARSMEAMTRLTGSMVGTPAYMAPEQVAGKSVDYRTDVYSLGLIMYEVFTGVPAFQADNAVAIALKQMRESPTPPHEIEPTVPVSIERAILKCLEKEPARRFQSIGELETALRATGTMAALPAPAAVAPTYSSHATLAAPPVLLAPEPNRPSPLVWVLLGVLLVGAAYAGLRAEQVMQSAENLSPPAQSPAPVPPDFALAIPAAQPEPVAAAPVESKPEATAPAVAKPAPPPQPQVLKPSKRALANAAPRAAAPAKNPSPAPRQGVAPQEVQRRADKAFGETEPVAVPPVNDHTPSYLWIGRFEREDRAQITAKKIEDLGLPVVVIPRHNDKGEFFVVLTGPFGPERVESAMDWLKAQGFPNVRLVKNPLGNQRPGSN